MTREQDVLVVDCEEHSLEEQCIPGFTEKAKVPGARVAALELL